MPKVKPGQSRKGKNKAPKTTTQRGQSSSTGLSAEAEQALIDKIGNSVVDKLIKGGPTTEQEGEEHFMKAVVHCSMLCKEYIGLLGMTDSVELATT
jgi:hypothetical protein